jgi:hypothetical protein
VNRDYGVQVYYPYQDALDFIKRFNLSLVSGLAPRGDSVTRYVDFSNGKELRNYTALDANAEIGAIVQFYNILTQKGYDKMVEPGFWNLPAGPQIPDDLLLPIGEFVNKYNITAALPRMYESTGGGDGSRGNFTNILTLTLLQSFPPSWIQVFFGAIGFYHIDGGNQLLYSKIASALGSDVLYSTVVTKSERDDTGVKLTVSGKDGTKLIVAKKLLLAIPPTRENLAPFDLNAEETDIFSKPQYGRYHTAIVSHPSLPNATELRNMPTVAIKDPELPYLDTPFVLSFASYGNNTNLFSIGTSGSSYPLYTPEAAQAAAQKALQVMADAGTVPDLKGKPLTVVEWSDHGPGGFGVSAAEMRAGWMSKLYGLQGKRSTWFTGNGVAIDFSTVLWKFNDDLIPRILKSW